MLDGTLSYTRILLSMKLYITCIFKWHKLSLKRPEPRHAEFGSLLKRIHSKLVELDIHRKRGLTFEFLLRQPVDYFVAWRWMKSCNALQGALSDFLQTVIHLSFFIVNKSSSYQTTTKQTHFTKLQRYTDGFYN